MSFTAGIQARIGWEWDDGAVDQSFLNYAKEHADGNDEDEAEAVWHEANQTLLDGATRTLDLTALTRTVLGDTHTVTFLTIKAILIVSRSTSVGELVVGGAASNEWAYPFSADGDQANVPVDSPWLIANRKWGWAVDADNKNFKLAASGGAVYYDIAIIGTLTASASGSSGT